MGDSTAAIRFFGDDLVPDELSKLLGCQPTDACLKGGASDVGQLLPDGTRVANSGRWILDAERKEPVDIDKQVTEILGKMTNDLNVWRDLRSKCSTIDIFCGVFKSGEGDGIFLTASSLAALGQRGIDLAVDIYGEILPDEK